jgi:hypothetical protein
MSIRRIDLVKEPKRDLLRVVHGFGLGEGFANGLGVRGWERNCMVSREHGTGGAE